MPECILFPSCEWVAFHLAALRKVWLAGGMAGVQQCSNGQMTKFQEILIKDLQLEPSGASRSSFPIRVYKDAESKADLLLLERAKT